MRFLDIVFVRLATRKHVGNEKTEMVTRYQSLPGFAEI
jgi:hypothetical protein